MSVWASGRITRVQCGVTGQASECGLTGRWMNACRLWHPRLTLQKRNTTLPKSCDPDVLTAPRSQLSASHAVMLIVLNSKHNAAATNKFLKIWGLRSVMEKDCGIQVRRRVQWPFGGVCCFHLQGSPRRFLWLEAPRCSETSVTNYSQRDVISQKT